ncbi:MAG: DUF2892 domain-containing protein [Phycisphaerales bacterium]|nr:DUF2892 domain-containing protein [Phycisphaerales bacterium]
MERNLETTDRTLRMTAGVFLILGGLLLVILCYLQILEAWWFIVAGSLAILGIGGVLSAATGKCMMRKVIGH